MKHASRQREAPARTEPACGVIVARPDGRVHLATPRARSYLERYFAHVPGPDGNLPAVLTRWVSQERETHPGGDGNAPPLIVPGETQQLVMWLLMTREATVLLLEEMATISRRLPELTRREAEVIAWVAEGKTNVEIGTILGIGPRTVQHHLRRIYRKLGVENRMSAARVLLATLTPSGDA